MSSRFILVGDLGGTKARLAVYEVSNGWFRRRDTETYRCADYDRFEAIIQKFLTDHPISVTRACLGVPGPVSAGLFKMTNLPWTLDATRIAEVTGIPEVRLVNDLLATAAALPHLKAEDLETLYPGKGTRSPQAPCAVLAPGTGLGQAFLVYGDGRPVPLSSEGSHVDFAPAGERELELWSYLHKRYGHVSYERVLSGPGLLNLYEFLRDSGTAPEPPELAQELARADDRPAVVAQHALNGTSELCVQALEWFVALLGAQAGNLVLTLNATGGVYLAGGIPTKIEPKLTNERLLPAYLNKGRLTDLVEKAPIFLIKNEYAPLLGAAQLAVL